MCVYSMVADYYGDKWRDMIKQPQVYPGVPIQPTAPVPHIGCDGLVYVPVPPQLTPEEVADFRELIKRARAYDEREKQKDCELESKKQLLRDLAKMLGVDDIFGERSETKEVTK